MYPPYVAIRHLIIYSVHSRRSDPLTGCDERSYSRVTWAVIGVMSSRLLDGGSAAPTRVHDATEPRRCRWPAGRKPSRRTARVIFLPSVPAPASRCAPRERATL